MLRKLLNFVLLSIGVTPPGGDAATHAYERPVRRPSAGSPEEERAGKPARDRPRGAKSDG